MSDPYYSPRFEVRIAGMVLDENVTEQVLSVSYEGSTEVADMFTVTLNNAAHQFTDSALFDLGKRVEIHMGYGRDLRPMMLGEITSVQPSFPESGAPTIRISGYDRSHRMRHNQPDRPAFLFSNHSLIAAQIALENGLIPIVDPSPFFEEHKQQTQSDMALLKEMAERNFFEVYVHWDRLYFRLPRPQTEAYVLEWGKNLSSFSPRLSSAGMAGLQVIRGYNEQLGQAVVGFATSLDVDVDNLVERVGTQVVDLLVSLGRRVVRDKNISSPFDAALFAKAVLKQILEGMYEGTGSCIGIPELTPNSYVVFRNVGKRFSGVYRIKQVTHTIDGSGYRTSFEITQKSSSTLLSLIRKAAVDMPPPDQQPPIQGVVVGKVSKNVDLEGRGRVKVTFPWLSDRTESAWARCVTPMAGANEGMYFLPDVDDEVLVGFLHGDIAKPVVLGSLWNGVDRPPETHLDGRNRLRVIKTKAGHKITLDDTLGMEKVVIQDRGGSEITMNADGSVTVSAKTSLTLKANTKIDLKAPDVNVQVVNAMNVT